MLLQGRVPAMDKEGPPQVTRGAARTSHPWGLSWEMALELPGKAFQGQGSFKDTRPTDGGGCINSSPRAQARGSLQMATCAWEPW